MMPETLFGAVGALLFASGLFGLFSIDHLQRQIIASNIAASGVFLVLLSTLRTEALGIADPVVQALILTGIVISVSITAFALALLRRLVELTGKAQLDPEDE